MSQKHLLLVYYGVDLRSNVSRLARCACSLDDYATVALRSSYLTQIYSVLANGETGETNMDDLVAYMEEQNLRESPVCSIVCAMVRLIRPT